jgi:hypothetical protein
LPTWKNAVPIQWMTRVTGSPLNPTGSSISLLGDRRMRSIPLVNSIRPEPSVRTTLPGSIRAPVRRACQ